MTASPARPRTLLFYVPALLDVSTGEFRTMEFRGEHARALAIDALLLVDDGAFGWRRLAALGAFNLEPVDLHRRMTVRGKAGEDGDVAAALGLHRPLALRLVVVPQALRLITPPLTSQYLNIIKNSSLAVFVGYPDLVLVFAGTVLNQTHAAMQVMAVTMAVYLAISLVVSFALNLFDARNALKER